MSIMKSGKWYVYLLMCKDGSLYTGVTNDLDKRMDKHASGKGSKYVYLKGFEKLVFSRLCRNKSDACKKEYQIKQLTRLEKLRWFSED